MRKNTAPRKTRGEEQLTITERDWRTIINEGGQWTLEAGVDYQGKTATAASEVRLNMRNRMGNWTVSHDKEQIIITVTPKQG